MQNTRRTQKKFKIQKHYIRKLYLLYVVGHPYRYDGHYFHEKKADKYLYKIEKQKKYLLSFIFFKKILKYRNK